MYNNKIAENEILNSKLKSEIANSEYLGDEINFLKKQMELSNTK